jgi:hypothetical protein
MLGISKHRYLGCDCFTNRLTLRELKRRRKSEGRLLEVHTSTIGIVAMTKYSDLYFTQVQLFLSADEAFNVAAGFWNTGALSPQNFSNRDLAFIQRALLIAVDKSEHAGRLFDLWSGFVSAAPSQKVKVLVRALAQKTAMRWFPNYIDSSPKISAVGIAAIQEDSMTVEWRLRVALDDDNQITNYLI